jgi:hypothetical protein
MSWHLVWVPALLPHMTAGLGLQDISTLCFSCAVVGGFELLLQCYSRSLTQLRYDLYGLKYDDSGHWNAVTAIQIRRENGRDLSLTCK